MCPTILNNILPSIKERHICQCLTALKRNIPVIWFVFMSWWVTEYCQYLVIHHGINTNREIQEYGKILRNVKILDLLMF